MTTTIAIKEGTMNMLKTLREEEHAESYDDVIRSLIKQTRQKEPSMRGKARNTPAFMREEIDRFA